MADEKKAARKTAKSAAKGEYKPSSIGAKARAAANKLKTGNTESKPATESRKLEPRKENSGLYSGKHRSSSSKPDSKSGYEFGGKHSKGTPSGKHHAPATRKSVTKNMVTDSGTSSTGKHSKEGTVSRMKAGMAERKAARAKTGRK